MKGALYFPVSNSAWVKDRLVWAENNLKISNMVYLWVWAMEETMAFSCDMQGHKILLLAIIFSAGGWISNSFSSRSVAAVLFVVLQMLRGRVQVGQSSFANLETKARDTSHKK